MTLPTTSAMFERFDAMVETIADPQAPGHARSGAEPSPG